MENKEDLSKYLKALDNTVNYDDKSDPLQKHNHNVHIICGAKGSGKSTLVLNMLRSKKFYRRHFNNIFLISPSAQKDDKFQKLCEELSAENKCYEDCDYDTLKEVYERVLDFNSSFKQRKKKGIPRNLLILDDCISDLNKDAKIKNLINKIVMNSRHAKLSLWVITQKYKLVSTAIRGNADMLTFFNTNNNVEKQALEENGIDVRLLDQLEKPSDFIHVVTKGLNRYFINMKPIISIEDTKKNNPPLDKSHGGFVRGTPKFHDSVLCLLKVGEIVVPKEKVDDKLIEYLEKEKGYNDKTGEFEK